MIEPRLVIYGLFDPRTGELRYVGKSTTGVRHRVSSHLYPSSLRDRTLKIGWLKSLLKRGLKPEAEVIEAVAQKTDLDEAERHHIAMFRALGCRLTNMTSGGDGLGGMSPTAETREKIAAAQRGVPRKPLPREVYERNAERMRGRSKDPAAVEKTAAALRGKPRPAHVHAALRSGTIKKWGAASGYEDMVRSRGGRPFVDQHGVEYLGIQRTARQLGLNAAHIHAVLNGRRRHTGGFTFQYKTPT